MGYACRRPFAITVRSIPHHEKVSNIGPVQTAGPVVSTAHDINPVAGIAVAISPPPPASP